MIIEKADFRNAMSRMGAAVNVVTSDGPAGRCGYTCTAACSVTDDPATVLVCLNRGSALNPVFKANGVFCINVLSGDQKHLSAQFSGQAEIAMQDRFIEGDWTTMESGSPAANRATCAVDCEIIEVKEVGTHSILFGRVLQVRLSAAADTLVYCDRAYHAIPHASAVL